MVSKSINDVRFKLLEFLFNMISDCVVDVPLELDIDLHLVAHVVSLADSDIGKEIWICCVHFASLFKNRFHEFTNIFWREFTLDLSHIVTLFVFFQHFQYAFRYNNLFTVGGYVRVDQGQILWISLSKQLPDMVHRDSLFVSQIERGNNSSRLIQNVSRWRLRSWLLNRLDTDIFKVCIRKQLFNRLSLEKLCRVSSHFVLGSGSRLSWDTD